MIINILINPKCLKVQNIINAIKANFAFDDVAVYKTLRRVTPPDRTKPDRLRAADLLIAVGGDGTVNEAVNAIAGSGTALAIIPCGTANDLASLYNLPSDIYNACRIIKQNYRIKIDLISINHRLYATAGGLGFASRVVEIANLMKRLHLARRLKGRLYQLAVIMALFNTKYRFNQLAISDNSRLTNLNAFSIFVNNQEYLGKNIRITPGACNSDSVFDICIIKNPLNRYQVITLLLKTLTASHINLPYVEFLKAASVRITSRSRLKYFGDGEILDEGNSFEINIIPRVLDMIVNPHHEGN